MNIHNRIFKNGKIIRRWEQHFIQKSDNYLIIESKIFRHSPVYFSKISELDDWIGTENIE